jgi:hypothetical protein
VQWLGLAEHLQSAEQYAGNLDVLLEEGTLIRGENVIRQTRSNAGSALHTVLRFGLACGASETRTLPALRHAIASALAPRKRSSLLLVEPAVIMQRWSAGYCG